MMNVYILKSFDNELTTQLMNNFPYSYCTYDVAFDTNLVRFDFVHLINLHLEYNWKIFLKSYKLGTKEIYRIRCWESDLQGRGKSYLYIYFKDGSYQAFSQVLSEPIQQFLISLLFENKDQIIEFSNFIMEIHQ